MSLLDSAIGTLQSAYNTASNTVQGWSQYWQDQYNELKAKAREFLNLYNDLEKRSSIAAKNPALNAEYNSLMSKGSYIKSTIEGILGSDSMAQLNAIPLIPIAAVLAAIAAITAWLAPAYTMQKKLELAEKMLAQGYDPTDIVNAGEGSPITDAANAVQEVTKLLPWAAASFILYKYWPVIQKGLKNAGR